MRSSNTKVRGLIGLIEAGSGMIYGECNLKSSRRLTNEEYISCFEKHKVSDISLLSKWSYAWELEDVLLYEDPIPYNHKRGAVIWVNL